MLPGHRPRRAPRSFAERVRRAVASGDAPIALTISAGVAAEAIPSTPFALTQAADAALYDAKRDGRDRVVRASSKPDLGTVRQMHRYELVFEDRFDGDELDASRWLPYYLPQWSSRERAAARYTVGGGDLRLRIDADQQAWCPEWDGEMRVSSLQTGVFSGPVGSPLGQQRFNPEAVVREAQAPQQLYLQHHGRIETRFRALADPRTMVALWMVGFEDVPERSGEICVAEIFGRDVRDGEAAVGMGIHPVGDPDLVEEFAREPLAIDVREFHVYAAEWTADGVVVLRRRRARQDRRTVAHVPHAADARRLRVPRLPRRAARRAIRRSSWSTTCAGRD